jgi:hypothetical protein
MIKNYLNVKRSWIAAVILAIVLLFVLPNDAPIVCTDNTPVYVQQPGGKIQMCLPGFANPGKEILQHRYNDTTYIHRSPTYSFRSAAHSILPMLFMIDHERRGNAENPRISQTE